MKYLTLLLLTGLVCLPSQGCSVYLAASQPEKVDVKAIEGGGMSRDAVIARLGAPTSSIENDDGTRTDIYQFYEGSETGWKVGRAAFHATADVFTLGLWEIVGTPTEMAVKGDKVTARAEFDKNDKLVNFEVLGVDKEETTDAESVAAADYD